MKFRHIIPRTINTIIIILLSVFCGFILCKQCNPVESEKHTEPENDVRTSQQPKENASEIADSAASQRLIITASEVNDSSYSTHIDPEQLNGNMDRSLIYYQLKDVMIELDGESIKLEDAISEDLISLEEIFAYARLDSKNGFCTEDHQSSNGLTIFIYSYPNLDIKLIYDVYETPDGKQHLINDFAVCKSGIRPLRVYADEKGQVLDREDWGLSYEVLQISPSSITVEYTQKDGQHIGELTAESFYIITGQNKRLEALNENDSWFYSLPNTAIHNDTSAQLTIDWTSIYGTLPPGEYKLCLQIRDHYDEKQTNPLTRNFYDFQQYWIAFSIK